jgi:CubicO group peptidase (beta-lactamase class C family)
VIGPDGVEAEAIEGLRMAGRDAQVAPGDAWHIGSNSKAVTATLALRLAEQGVIALDATVGGTLGEGFTVDPAWDRVTLRQLLAHRGGISANAGRLTMLRYMAMPTETIEAAGRARRGVLANYLKRPPEHAPGEDYVYSNLGYSLAGLMLEVASGRPFETLLEEEVFGPLGMEGVMIGAPSGPAGSVIRGHRRTPPRPAPDGADNPAFMAPAGTISYPPAAYAIFLQDQLRGQLGLPGTLLPPESYREMATPPVDGADYGLGWGLGPQGALVHNGSNTMWFARATVVPEARIAVAILANDGEIDRVAPAIREAVDGLVARYGAAD